MPASGDSSEVNDPSTALRVALAVFALLVLLYSFLVATRPLLGVAFIVWLFAVYLLWRFFHLASRFVSAVERIAATLEEDR